MTTHTDGKEAQRNSSGAQKDEQYSRSVDGGTQEPVAGHEREAIDYEREEHQPQKRRDEAKARRSGDRFETEKKPC
ncbi:hypothetical protein [Parvibaculum sp.]|uniref:hypothetical protein n=1 Tax=Parvibaculum sp. TaxID=2024848 RepID=UPI002BBCA275|nr:hypothetical protein [Parvibaculum sp.]HUD50457.1 hypothetical protein [Parvibaculum sp.]